MNEKWKSSFVNWLFPASRYAISRALFVRGTGLVFLIAFLSWWTQAIPLTGKEGLLPVGEFLEYVGQRDLGAWEVPSVFWMTHSDLAIHVVCGLGVFLALLVTLGFITGPGLLGAWILYLSLVTTGGNFMSFQWDILLLETGVLAVIAAPWKCSWLRLSRPPALDLSARMTMWLCWLVIAKLMFLSGWVKLAWATEQQPEWWPDHTAMTFHYFTQPLPTWTAWWMHQLPEWFHRASIWPMYFVELVLPFFVFLGARMRLLAGVGFIGLMLLIAATGNYTYFNLLTVVLCLPLIADRWFPKRLSTEEPDTGHSKIGLGLLVRGPVLLLLVVLNFQVLFGDLSRSGRRPWLSNLHLTSGYGLFRTMTTTRPEIVIEGSQDGLTWLEYDLKWKPGDLDVRPRFVAPHQPRLDWQFWFFALGERYHPQNPNAVWFSRLIEKTLRGGPMLDRYYAEVPFPNSPPKKVRANLYLYEFTNREERAKTGRWWSRRLVGAFLPEVSLR